MQLNDKTFKIGILRRRRRFWVNFFQTSSAFGDLLDLSDHPLLLDIFSQGPPQLRTGLGFLFFFKVSFEKHPSEHAVSDLNTFLLFGWRKQSSERKSYFCVLDVFVRPTSRMPLTRIACFSPFSFDRCNTWGKLFWHTFNLGKICSQLLCWKLWISFDQMINEFNQILSQILCKYYI